MSSFLLPVSLENDLSEAVEVPKGANDENDAHVVEQVQELNVLEKSHGAEEEEDSDVVKEVEEATKVHMNTRDEWWFACTECLGSSGRVMRVCCGCFDWSVTMWNEEGRLRGWEPPFCSAIPLTCEKDVADDAYCYDSV